MTRHTSERISSRLLPLLDSLPPVAPLAPCRAGCAACCLGPFDISPAEAAMVRIAVAALPPEVGDGVRERAAAQRFEYHLLEPSWVAPWDTDVLGEERFDRICDLLAALPCPALDPANHHCLIHSHRPGNCRITGTAIATVEGGLLENVCPIQEEYPSYAALPPIPFDLESWEAAVETIDGESMLAGFTRTTVAGALDG